MREIHCANCGSEVSHTELGKGLYKCLECGTIRSVDVVARAKPLRVKFIISELESSRSSYAELRKKETVKLDEEIAIEEEDEVEIVQITAIEKKGGKRVKSAKGEEITCLWGKVVSEVIVKIAVQEKGKTRSLAIKAAGDREFSVGGREKIDGEAVEITAIKIRKGRVKKRAGDTALAKDVKRIFSKPAREGLVRERPARGRHSGERSAKAGIKKRRS